MNADEHGGERQGPVRAAPSSVSIRVHSWLLIGAVLLAVALRVAWFSVAVTRLQPSSDMSIPLLQARGIVQPDGSMLLRTKRHPRGLHGRFPLLMMAQPYLFPTEAYLSAPVALFLPTNTFGALIIPAILALLSVWLGLLVLRRWGDWREVWPGVLLVLFPSAYVLILQAGYALPGYPAMMCLSALALYLAQRHGEARWPWLNAFFAGLAAGLAVSSSLLAAPVLIGVAAVVMLSNHWKKCLLSFPTFGIGAALGLFPHFAAKHFYPGAYGAVSNTFPWPDTLRRLWDPAITFTLPAGMGVTPPFWADNERMATLVPGLEKIFPWVWVALMVAATGVALWCFVARSIRNRWPTVAVGEALIGVTWISLVMFAMNRRSSSGEYRYLLLAVLSFPFVVAYLFAGAGRAVKAVLGTLAVLLLALNLAGAVVVLRDWARPGFAQDEAYIYDLEPVIGCLEDTGVDRAYASWHFAYRITYMTGERILCAQYFNERFPGWPLPYKDVVDAATNVAYVLGPTFGIRAEHFAADLEAQGVAARREEVGGFSVFTDFEWSPPTPEEKVDARIVSMETTHNAEEAGALTDGDYTSRWRSRTGQVRAMAVNVRLSAPKSVNRVSMYYNHYRHDRAPALTVRARGADGRWVVCARDVERGLEPFEFIHGHPVMGNELQTIRFRPVLADMLRIEIADPQAERDWTIGEIEVYHDPTSGRRQRGDR